MIPSTSSGTTVAPSSELVMHRIECSGRTHFNVPLPQRMDFGHGKLRIVRSKTSATISAAGRPSFVILAKKMFPLGVSRSSRSSRVKPAPRKKPLIAFSGASAFGPLRSSTVVGDASSIPSTVSVRRRGVLNAAAEA